MEVEFNLTPEDVIAFLRYHADNPPSGRRLSWRSNLLAALLCCLLGLVGMFLILPAQVPVLSPDLLPFVLAPALLLGVYLFRHRFIAAATRRLLRGGDAKLLGEQRLGITPEGVTHSTQFSAATVLWIGIEKIAVTKDHAFFYITTRSAYVVPRWAFANEWEFDELVETAKRYREKAVRP